ncbi:hypothetical protein HAZT_HAZT007596 [Hyalella azteca]|uniref:Uncharacterized protein n=1 Tax=Hyalella azteca TaxID=294128 RepID=A0A6A0GX39_HYAAZ|nr:hypothetical protein HAZT_HAZT007596 [Hyalella azteca]
MSRSDSLVPLSAVVAQDYLLEAHSKSVIRWNAAPLEVRGAVLLVAQTYETDVDNEYVIVGNAAVMRCDVPSFKTDFVTVTTWHEEVTGQTYQPQRDYG